MEWIPFADTGEAETVPGTVGCWFGAAVTRPLFGVAGAGGGVFAAGGRPRREAAHNARQRPGARDVRLRRFSAGAESAIRMRVEAGG